MLAELRRLRVLQLDQAEALAEGDTERLGALNSERVRLQACVLPGEAPALSPGEREEARALMALLQRDQEELAQRAAAARDALRDELRGLGTGRTALQGYRPVPTGSSLYVDRSR